MSKFKCFAGEIEPGRLDRTPFSFRHQLADHPALSLENLAEVISSLPKNNVMFSKNLSDVKKNFENVLAEGKRAFDMTEVIETIRTGNSYIAARGPEMHPSISGIFQSIVEDLGVLLKANNSGSEPLEPTFWVFIASPGAVTPFHFDRYSNFIMQIRGSKELAVFPPRVEKAISAEVVETYLDWGPCNAEWTEEKDHLAHKFDFKKGEAVHIPFTSGHYVRNGTQDISVSLSIFFHSNETKMWSEAMKCNNRLRRLGISPTGVGESEIRDWAKARILFPLIDLRNKVGKSRQKRAGAGY